MKIGILTFHCAYNYGAVLQCYALYKTITDMGYETSIINYRPSYLNTRKPYLKKKSILSLRFLEVVSSYLRKRSHYMGFHRFVTLEMKMSTECISFEQTEAIISNYDMIIVGSDQVWNAKYNNFDKVWYGGYGDVKWGAYAPSAGDCNFTDNELKRLANCLPLFSFLSSRELVLSNIMADIVHHDVPTLLDPSLLASPKIWEKFFKPIIKGNYILTYQARESDMVFEVAQNLTAQFENCKIIPIDSFSNVQRMGYRQYIASPSQFVSLVKNACCVITTSFHATAFSIICRTPFYTLRLNDNADERTANLLELVGLKNRMISEGQIPNVGSIDWDKVNIKLCSYRENSLSFLKSALVC